MKDTDTKGCVLCNPIHTPSIERAHAQRYAVLSHSRTPSHHALLLLGRRNHRPQGTRDSSETRNLSSFTLIFSGGSSPWRQRCIPVVKNSVSASVKDDPRFTHQRHLKDICASDADLQSGVRQKLRRTHWK